MHQFLVVSYELVMRFLFGLPRFPLFDRVKAMFLRLRGAAIGKRVVFYPGVWIAPGNKFRLGDDVDLALDVIITSGGGVSIGDRTLVGYRTQILSTNHGVPEGKGAIFGAGHVPAEVVIGQDVWIAGGCMILPGVSIGDGAVIAGGAVVTSNVPPYEIWGGVPARKLRSRLAPTDSSAA